MNLVIKPFGHFYVCTFSALNVHKQQATESDVVVKYLVCLLLHHLQGEEDVEMCATELLYQGILPSLPQYMVSVLSDLQLLLSFSIFDQ